MFLSIGSVSAQNVPFTTTRITRSLKSVQDSASFVLQGRNIEIYTGALSISLSPGRVLYTGKNSVDITYQNLSMTG